ncbi:hypothetical protein LBMAG56_20360 [Verrucomicrobiota bacterium]|nr:hypothetical protein LBMAG56_20360 [Verrucomicrobiota bacterium]
MPNDAVKMGEVIESLGGRLRSNKEQNREEAAELLNFIQDDRTVPHFAAAVQNENRSAMVFHHAFDTFGRNLSIEALEGLKFGISTNQARLAANSYLSGIVRHSAAYGLARSNNPDALRHLMTFKHDASDSVRLIVVQRVGKERNDEATEIIEELCGDASQMVSGEARRYLALIHASN